MADCSEKLKSGYSLKKVQEIILYLKNILLEKHYILIQTVTDNTREKEFSKKKKQNVDKYVDSTLCKTNWKGNQHIDLMSNLETVFNCILFQLRLKVALTNNAEILQNLIVD